MSETLTGLGVVDTRLAVYITFGLAALAHLYLALRARMPGHLQGHGQVLGVVAELFEGGRASLVLKIVIATVNHLASPDTGGRWQEKVEVFRLATVIANAVSTAVKARAISAANVGQLHALLEKSLRHQCRHTAAGALQFAIAFPTVSPPPVLDRALRQIVYRKDPGPGRSMFLPLVSVGFFGRNPTPELIGDMLHSLLACAFLPVDDYSCSYFLVVQERVQFTKQLTKAVPRLKRLRRTLTDTLLSAPFKSSISGFIPCQLPVPDDSNSVTAGRHSCGEAEACVQTVLGVRHRLQRALCSLFITCALHARAADGVRLAPGAAMACIKRLMDQSTTPQERPAAQAPAPAPSGTRAISEGPANRASVRDRHQPTRLEDLVRGHYVLATAVAEKVKVLQREFEETRRCQIEELKEVAGGANRVAAETAVYVNAVSRDVSALSAHRLELEREVGELKDQLAKFREDHASLESLIESLRPGLAETRKDLGGSGGGGGRAAKLFDRPIDAEEECGAMDLQMDLGHEQKAWPVSCFAPCPLPMIESFFSSEGVSGAGLVWSSVHRA